MKSENKQVLPIDAWAARLAYAAAVAGIIAVSGVAHAQTPAAPAGAELTLDEIVITAQRREETLQHAAIAVTALTGATVAERDVTIAADLTRVVPSVAFATGGGGTSQVSLRGVGSLTGNELAEVVIAFNMDGVYLARSGGSNGLFLDLARIEVLKGPQGTLYGRNATAGAINLVSEKPKHEFGGDVGFRVGNYGLFEADAVLNLPASDTLAFRVAAQRIKHDGYFTDGYGDQGQYTGRVSMLFDPSDAFSFLLTTDVVRINDKGSSQVLYAPFVDPKNPWLGLSSPQSIAVYRNTPPTSFLESPPETNGYNKQGQNGITGTLDWKLGEGKLTAIAGYRNTTFNYSTPTPGFRLDEFDDSSNTKSLEIRYATPEQNRLRGVIGAYYFNDSGEFNINTYITDLVSGPSATVINDFHTRATAGFGQATFDLTPTVRLIGGLRYSGEKKTVNGTINAPPVPIEGSLSFNKLTYRAGIEADVAPQSLAYFTYATGFKAGGFYTGGAPNTFKPEFLDAWTVGSKNRFLDNRVQLNAELFYWKYKDKQVNHLGPINPVGFSLITENAGQAKLYGLELESEFLITPQDKVGASVQYEHTRYDSYVVNVSPTPPTTGCPVTPVNPITFRVDCSGNEIALAPHWSGTVDYSHTFPIPAGGNVVFLADGIAKSRYWLGDDHVIGEQQPGYMVGDLSLTYNAVHDRWSVGGFVNNVNNRAVASFSFIQPLLGRPMAVIGPPRTYGAMVNFKF